jgi:TPR repeat protein
VRQDLEMKSALMTKSVSEAAQLKKTAETAAAELEQERQKNASLAHDLVAARRDSEAKSALSSSVGDETVHLKKAAEDTAAELRLERIKTVELTNDLATARRELESKVAPSSKPGDETLQLGNAAGVGTRKSQQELQTTRSTDPGMAAVTKRNVAALSQPANAGANVDPQAAYLVARAKLLLSQGNINPGRNVLERAIDLGSKEAIFALAETYDPRMLSRWNVYGTRGDLSKARELYERAAAVGIVEAKERLTSLNH